MPEKTVNDGTLSPAGVRRREAMLDELAVFMRRTHERRRRRTRAATAAAMLALTAAATWIALPGTPARSTRVAPAVRIVTDTPRTGVIRAIDDDELVDLLARIDRPAGIIELDGRTRLTAPVTDRELRAIREEEPGVGS